MKPQGCTQQVGCGVAVVFVVLLALLTICTAPLQLASVAITVAVPKLHIQLPQIPGGVNDVPSQAVHIPNGAAGRVVDTALAMGHHLRLGLDMEYDDYDNAMPAIPYWQSVCPMYQSDCWVYWEHNNLQCVMFVTGAWGVAGMPLPVAHNAYQFWGDYAGLSGWKEIPNGSGLPQPGDIMVWYHPPNGHVAIVYSVTTPGNGHNGYVRFVQGNSPTITDQHEILNGSNYVVTWPGFTLYGFLRPANW